MKEQIHYIGLCVGCEMTDQNLDNSKSVRLEERSVTMTMMMRVGGRVLDVIV